jgi:hypothetical protein
MTKGTRFTVRALAAALVAGGLVAAAATPSGGQTQEVVEVRGDAYGIFVEVQTDITGGNELPFGELIEAANDGDQARIESLLEGAGVDPESVASQPNPQGTISLTFGPTPEVTLPPEGGSLSDEESSINLFDLLLIGLAEVSTEGELGPNGFAQSDANLTRFSVPEVFSIQELNANCNADLGGVSGDTTILNGDSIAGELPDNPAPNEVFVDESGSIGPFGFEILAVLNEQESDPDDISVNGAHVTASLTFFPKEGDPILLIGVEMIASHVSCGLTAVEIPPPPPVRPVQAQPRFTG